MEAERLSEDEHDGAELAAAVGRAVRETRTAQRLTLNEIAKRTGLSQAFLSQLENGRSMPSLLTLHRVAAVLGTSAHALLELGTTPQIELVRADQGRTHALTRGATLRFLTEGRRQMGPTEVRAEPFTAASEHTEHAGEEFTFVLEGRLVIEIGSQVVELEPGDGLYYPATVRHRWRNDTDAVLRFLIVTNPPTF